MPFKFKRLRIPDVILIEPQVFEESRIKTNFVQGNHSKSKKNVLRGLHYQISPMEQAKLVRCIRRKIFDVAVDIRKGSSSYGKWIGGYLSDENKNILFIPARFAHGYLVVSEEAEIIYRVTKEYSPKHDRGIIWNDHAIGIDWPLSEEPILSEKDKNLPNLEESLNRFYKN